MRLMVVTRRPLGFERERPETVRVMVCSTMMRVSGEDIVGGEFSEVIGCVGYIDWDKSKLALDRDRSGAAEAAKMDQMTGGFDCFMVSERGNKVIVYVLSSGLVSCFH